MNSGRYFMPNMGMVRNSMMNSMPMMGSRAMLGSRAMMGANMANPRGLGIFGRIVRSIRAINWGNLLTNANKTINVVNQTIPLVRQAGPMFNNMRSMLKIAKAFGNETNSSSKNINSSKNSNFNENMIDNSSIDENESQKKEVQNDNFPNFFV